MSMYQIEDFVEKAVRTVATSQLNVQEKRNLIHTLFEMESYGDCSFTNLRTIQEMVGCSYSFVFDPEEMYGYRQNPERDRADGDRDDFGEAYLDEETGKYCVDSGSAIWSEMVKSGAITGEGALPVRVVPFVDAFKQLSTLLGKMDRYTQTGFSATLFLTGTFDEMTDEDCMAIFGMSKEKAEEAFDSEDESAEEASGFCQPSLITYSILGQACTFSPEAYVNEEGALILKKFSGQYVSFNAFGQRMPFSIEVVLDFQMPLLAAENWLFVKGDKEEGVAITDYLATIPLPFPLDSYMENIDNTLNSINDSVYIGSFAAQYAMARGKSANATPVIPLMWCVFTLSSTMTQCDLFLRIESKPDNYSFDWQLSNSTRIVREG